MVQSLSYTKRVCAIGSLFGIYRKYLVVGVATETFDNGLHARVAFLGGASVFGQLGREGKEDFDNGLGLCLLDTTQVQFLPNKSRVSVDLRLRLWGLWIFPIRV